MAETIFLSGLFDGSTSGIVYWNGVSLPVSGKEMRGVLGMERLVYACPVQTEIDKFHLFDLKEIQPGYRLLVNLSTPIVSLVPAESRPESLLLAQRILTASEIRVLLPLLAFRPCCPQEVLQASYFCEYNVLLQALFSSDTHILDRWNNLVQEHRVRLTDASQRKVRRREMKGVYNALFALRQKLVQLGLTIRARQDGFYFSPLVRQDLCSMTGTSAGSCH